MKFREKLWGKLPELLDLPDQALPGVPIIEVYGDRRVLVEGRCAVTRYDNECVQLRNSCGCISVSGCGLQMAELSYNRMIITGTICNISISRG